MAKEKEQDPGALSIVRLEFRYKKTAHCTMGSEIHVNLNIYTNKRSTISVPMNLTRGAGRR